MILFRWRSFSVGRQLFVLIAIYAGNDRSRHFIPAQSVLKLRSDSEVLLIEQAVSKHYIQITRMKRKHMVYINPVVKP
jgi:hypothetical protein